MRLHRFRYSPYARKVEMLLQLARISHEVVEEPYGDRNALAVLTGGSISVPVLEDGGQVILESRVICEHLLARPDAAHLLPTPLEGPVWAYHDFVDGPLEDVLFRIATPGVRDQWSTPFERALFAFVKERKFGAGCVDAWERDRAALVTQGKKLLAPTLRTLTKVPFVFGEKPTLADAALYGQCAMLEVAGADLLTTVDPALVAYARRVEAAAH
jgi:glutathione S-transferase